MEMTTNCVSSLGTQHLWRHGADLSPDQSVTPELFNRFQTLIYKESGIWLAAHKVSLLVGRLSRRLRLLGLSSLAEYHSLVVQPDQQHERALMIDCITTNETHFFREPLHFEFLAQRVFPRLAELANSGKRPKQIRIWSAGCSTGEEPYSLAMLLLKYFPPETGWSLEVLATDISTRVLEKARTAIFPLARTQEIPKDLLHAFMLKGREDQEGMAQMGPQARKFVRFARVNLQAESYPFTGLFDLIFCRNVMIYFDQNSKTRAIDRMLRHLSPTGLLFVGHSEALQQVTTRLKSIAPSVYAMADGTNNGAAIFSRAMAGKK
jgi:chemotaxis protein methyltransferase CheR